MFSKAALKCRGHYQIPLSNDKKALGANMDTPVKVHTITMLYNDLSFSNITLQKRSSNFDDWIPDSKKI